jgi:hypothetical protein
LRKKRGRPMALREKGEEIVKCVGERSERKSVENLRIFFFKKYLWFGKYPFCPCLKKSHRQFEK